jgi:ferredoxin-NADP reductase
MTERELLTARLTGKRLLAAPSQSYQLDLEVKDGAESEEPRDFEFLSGQFISIVADTVYPEGHARAGEPKQEVKAYSLAAPPRGPHIQLCLNRAGWFSNLLCDLQIGDAIRFHGPYGAFTRRKPHAPSLFVGADAGIVPIRSIFRDTVPAHATLIQTAVTRDDLLYRDEFASASTLRYLPMIAPEITAVEDRVRTLLRDHAEIQTAYLCGLNEKIAPVRAVLKELGWDRKQIVFERYD